MGSCSRNRWERGPSFDRFRTRISINTFPAGATMPNPIPAGHEGLIPHLICSPAADAIEFYKKAFGAEEIHRMPGPDGRLMHAAIRIDGRPLFLADDFPEYCGGKEQNANALGGTPVTIHRYVKDCDAV